MPRYNEILTEEFLDDIGACLRGIKFAIDNELIGLTIEEAILKAISLKKRKSDVVWLLCALNTSSNIMKVLSYIFSKVMDIDASNSENSKVISQRLYDAFEIVDDKDIDDCLNYALQLYKEQ